MKFAGFNPCTFNCPKDWGQDWGRGGLPMVLLDRSQVQSISGSHLFFTLKFVFTLNFLKMVSVWVCISPGFLSGGGFSADQFAPVWF
jgi:hypothetical protein